MPRNKKFMNLFKTSYLKDSAVTSAKIGALEVATADIAYHAITNSKLGPVQTKTLRFKYDFARLGGAIGAITLTSDDNLAQTIPDNAVITSVSIEGDTDNTSDGSATIALGYTGNVTAFLGATAFDHAMWNVDAVTTGAPGVAEGKTDAAVSVLATVATAALTAGKWYVWVEYYEGA